MNKVAQLFPSETPQSAPENRFEEFWQHYPKRVGKPLAKAKYEAVLKGMTTRTLDRDSGEYVTIELKATEDELIEGAKRYRATQIDPNTYRLKHGGDYTMHPSTWLNRGRWMDE